MWMRMSGSRLILGPPSMVGGARCAEAFHPLHLDVGDMIGRRRLGAVRGRRAGPARPRAALNQVGERPRRQTAAFSDAPSHSPSGVFVASTRISSAQSLPAARRRASARADQSGHRPGSVSSALAVSSSPLRWRRVESPAPAILTVRSASRSFELKCRYVGSSTSPGPPRCAPRGHRFAEHEPARAGVPVTAGRMPAVGARAAPPQLGHHLQTESGSSLSCNEPAKSSISSEDRSLPEWDLSSFTSPETRSARYEGLYQVLIQDGWRSALVPSQSSSGSVPIIIKPAASLLKRIRAGSLKREAFD